MRKLIFFGLLLYGGMYGKKFYKNALHKTPPKKAIASMNSCTNKKMCAIVYVAPWCPACEATLPQVKNFIKTAENSSDYGIQIIVGAGRNPGDNQKKADAIGDGAIIDDDKYIANALNVTYFPTFFVMKANKKIVMQDKDALAWMNKTFAAPIDSK